MKKTFGSSKSRPSGKPGKKKFSGDKSGFKPRRKFDGPPSDRNSDGERRKPYGDKPSWNKDKPGFKSDRPSYGDKPGYGAGGGAKRFDKDKPWSKDKPAWKSDRPSFKDKPRYDGPGSDRRSSEDRPSWKSDRPSGDSKRPSWNSDRSSQGDRPYRGGQQSGYKSDSGSKPAWKSDKPSYGDKPRYGDSDRPRRYDENKPSWKSDKPAWKSDKPSWKSDGKPAWKSDRPSYNDKPRYSDSDRPRKFDNDRPRKYDDNKPYKSDRPAYKSDRPAFKSDRPEYKSDRPSWKSDKPSYGGDRPRYNDPDRPRNDSDRPRKNYDSNSSWKSDRPERSGRPDGPPLKPAWKPDPNYLGKNRKDRDDDEVFSSGPVSVPSNKKSYGDSQRPSSSKPFSARIPEGSPNQKSLIVTLSDTNNVPVRLVWIFESMVGELPDGEPSAGDTVYVHDENHRFVGSAIYNPNSRIRARIFSLTRRRFDHDYLRDAIAKAVETRKQMGLVKETCRLVFGESDGIPGLIADKIGDYLVIQPLTFAVDQRLPFIVDQLNALLSPEGIVVRTDVPIRAKEGLVVGPPVLHGNVPERVMVKEDDCTVFANLNGGQKTGLFLDQRYNRGVMKPFCPNARVLDLFCHVGGWALAAANYGAKEVVGVDSSRPALELARAAAAETDITNVSFVEKDVFEYLKSVDTEPENQFDIIICDPPAFAKTRQHYEEAFRAYLSLNYLVMKRLKPGGLLVTCSCSQAVSALEFNEAILTSARNARMQFQILERRGAPADHPVLLGLPETEYLKCQVMLRTE